MLGAVAVLACAGLLNLAGGPSRILFVKQALFTAVGFLLILLFAAFDYRIFRSSLLAGGVVWGVGVFLLALTVIFRHEVRGAANWLFVGPFSIGPIEIVKIGILLVLASYLGREHQGLVFLKQLTISALVVAMPIALVFLQPDFGSAVILAALWFWMVVLLGLPLRNVIAILSLAIIAAAVMWGTVLHDYQKARIIAFVNPERDPMGVAYQSRQALIVAGSGGLWGRGFFAEDLASRLAFLPESATDFAFASLVEKGGFVTGSVILGAFGILLFRLERFARRASNNFSCAYALGLFVLFATETALNIGMNLRLLPVTGQPLPFVSYGGSHTLAAFTALGIFESVRLHQPRFAVGGFDGDERHRDRG
jgi:rod shape determining protein RodA